MNNPLRNKNPRRLGRGLEQAATTQTYQVDAINQYSIKINNPQNALKENIYQEKGDALYKSAIARRHMMRSPNGWAIDKMVLMSSISKGLIYAVIFEKEFHLYYRCYLKDFLVHGLEINYKNFGEQIILPLKYWQVTSPGQPEPTQLALPL